MVFRYRQDREDGQRAIVAINGSIMQTALLPVMWKMVTMASKKQASPPVDKGLQEKLSSFSL